jgi:23S rRNA pseudouridine2604 synthase
MKPGPKKNLADPKTGDYPMRINKYLAHKGYSTRRGADDLIAKGYVLINGKAAVLGSKVEAGDKVDVKSKEAPKKYKYFAYHKPVGIITHSPGEGEQDIRQDIAASPLPKDLFPVGRLDKNSSGIIILTNDGRITDRLLNPEYEHEKEYFVKTRENLRESFKKYMEMGVDIDGYKTKKCHVSVKGEREFVIRLTEGKKHQIRRMVVAMHNDVASLRRTRIMNVKLYDLPSGAHRPIEGEELAELLSQLGLKV